MTMRQFIGRLTLKKMLAFGMFLTMFVVYFCVKHLHHDANFILKLSSQFTDWFEEGVLGLSYKERFCNNVVYNNSVSVNAVVHQLNIRNEDVVFINGLHCGEWVVALKMMFPDIKLFGVDKDSESIEYVSSLVNGTFAQARPFELNKFVFDSNPRFDHAIVDKTLAVYPNNWQCETVKQMIPMLKAGGSMYIGNNYEECDKKDEEQRLKEHLHIRFLPQCFWSKQCLNMRPDVVEVLYTSNTDNSESKNESQTVKTLCSTSIYIYKHIAIESHIRNDLVPESKYKESKHNHVCTYSETKNKTRNHWELDIKKAVRDMKTKGLDTH